MRRKLSVVIEATYEQRPQFHRHWQIFVQNFLKVVETCDNVMKLHQKHTGGGAGGWKDFKFQLPDCFKVDIAESERAFPCSKRTPLCHAVFIRLCKRSPVTSYRLLTTKKNRSQLAVLQRRNSTAVPPSLKDLQTNNTLTKPDTGPSRHCSY